MNHTHAEDKIEYSPVVERDDGFRVSARAAHLLDQLEAADAELRKMDKQDRRLKYIGLGILLLLLIGGTFLFARTNALDQADQVNQSQIHDLQTTIRQLQTNGSALENQVRGLGAQPVATVPAPNVVQGPPGTNGQPGITPSDAALRTLIAQVIAENPPKDGHTPTVDEILAIVKPLIPAAIPGPTGQPGATPTDAQLLALIRPLIPDPIPGPTGQAGTNGQPGKDGATGAKGDPGPTCPDGFTPTQHQDTDVTGAPTGPVYIRCEQPAPAASTTPAPPTT